MTLKISIKPDKGETGQYFLESAITEKRPEFEPGKTIMFGTPDGNLQRSDPRQGSLDFRTIGGTDQPAKSVAETTQETREV
ncbi:hypothetical protein FKG94_03215 [Exilibacterium tricleocarpae]|uniref:Uncharacterized protein n=1 Tax=Exilibacterium tricleocarpae TaxID=2591008 RepID=A0A545U747_9GAMM|nr:hypothetical protein [Exilibacterium tricleocarpae]TQV85213.1 hypothetical protein FKG94_03215 [Exilibacterium tricleocarpae]